MIRPQPPLVALAAATVQRLLAGRTPPPTPGRAAAVVTLSSACLALDVAAGLGFRRASTTLDPSHPEQASTLVTTGAHSISRNPMYVGLVGLLTAHAIWRGSWAALAPVAGFVIFIDRLQIEREEVALRKRFGAEYDAYRAAVPRWLGRRSLTWS